MRKTNLLTMVAIMLPIFSFSQITFSNETATLLADTTLYSGAPIGIADMNGDFLDDIIRLSNRKDITISYQQSDGTMFTDYHYGAFSSNSWGISIADVDANGYNDIITGGYYDGLKLLTADANGSSYSLTTLSSPSIFLQGVNFVDIDNNGTIDIFACHDEGLSPPFSNDGNGNFTYTPGLINTSSTVPSDNSGNYGSVWTDYDSDGDLDLYLSKCRSSAPAPNDGRRLNLLFQNDGNNNYTDVAPAVGLQPMAQSWAAEFGDIDNDGDLDCFIINHDMTSQLYLNDGTGNFTNHTSDSGVSTDLAGVGGGIQCKFNDFDNDGFIDLLLTSLSNTDRLYKNDGDGTFTSVSGLYPGAAHGIHSAVTGDLDDDGYIDIYAGYGSSYNSAVSSRPDKLWINQGSGSNYCKVLLEGSSGNVNAIGARVEIHGAWGVQIREVRSGEGYGIMNSFVLHFGLGAEATIDEMVITWPSGLVETLCGVSANESLTLQQGNLPDLLSANIDYSEVDLEVSFMDASDGVTDSWNWNFGDGTTSMLQNPVHTFATEGPYTVSLTAMNDCETDSYIFDWTFGALPLDLTSFAAELNHQDHVAIRWTTENEIDFDYFDIERSTDSRNFQSIGKLNGKNNSLQNQYQLLDQFPEKGSNYYRLKQVDLDGSIEYSEIVAVRFQNSNLTINIYPNPGRDQLFISSESTTIESLWIYNATGKSVKTLHQVSENVELDISNWESGVYFLKLQINGQQEFKRFTKI